MNNETKIKLEKIGFDPANLREADLWGADLREANLQNTVLQNKTAEQKLVLRQTIQNNGGLILYRTEKSQHIGNTIYEVGKSYTAPVFSLCSVTECHPGIYGNTLVEMQKQYPGEALVKIYMPYGEWHFVSRKKGFRARRIRVLA